MNFGEPESVFAGNPVDLIEQIATRNSWSFERDDEDEISFTVAGRWCDYQVNFTWLAEMEALHLSASFDLKAPERRKMEVSQLIARLNEQMWIGHFDLWSSGSMVMYRHALLLAGGARPSPDQCETALKIAVEACERFYQAFQFVVWAGKSAGEALEAVLFETAGEA
ncbi:MAG: YbjN domain-containing protein [Proteobacteria bacterium]|nr:YbjN domain-containing protein [Pseudomonadota bacterium]